MSCITSIRRLLLALLCFVSFGAFAEFDAAKGWTNSEFYGGVFSTANEACEALAGTQPYLSYGWKPKAFNVTDTSAQCRNSAGEQIVAYATRANDLFCPAQSTKVGTKCVCDADHAERILNGVYSCVPLLEADCSTNGMIWNSDMTTDRSGRARGPYAKFADGAVACFASSSSPSGKGCKHMFTGDLGFKDDQGQDWTNGFSWAFTEKDLKDPRLKGELSCDLTDTPTEDQESAVKPNDPNCKNGYKGQVNDKEVCIEAWTGETQGVDFGITKGPDGTTTNTKNEITCKGDQCTVKETNTIKDANGNTIRTTTSTTDKVNRQTYCAKNPESSVCGRTEDQSGGSKGQGGKGGGGGKGGDSGELDDKYTEIGAPKLYDQKYEGGIKGVWEKHADGLKNSSIGGLAGKLFPNYGDGGSAPSYIIDLNLGGKLNLGSYDLNFDPRVWIALKAFTILCALAVARRLVFGG